MVAFCCYFSIEAGHSSTVLDASILPLYREGVTVPSGKTPRLWLDSTVNQVDKHLGLPRLGMIVPTANLYPCYCVFTVFALTCVCLVAFPPFLGLRCSKILSQLIVSNAEQLVCLWRGIVWWHCRTYQHSRDIACIISAKWVGSSQSKSRTQVLTLSPSWVS